MLFLYIGHILTYINSFLMYCSIKDSKLEKKLVIFLFPFPPLLHSKWEQNKRKKQYKMLKICQVMHTRSTSQKKMLEAMASAKCWRSWNGKEKLQVHVSTWVLTCTYTSSYHSQLVMLCSERTVYWSGNQKGDRVHGLTLRVGLQFLRGKIVFDFCHFVLQKPGSIYIKQPFSCL